MRPIGEIIRHIRKERGLTQLALAMRLGVTPQAVGKWERGESEPDLSLLIPLAEALRVTPGTLFGAEREDWRGCPDFLADGLPESLRRRRRAAGLTQTQLAERLGIRPQTVSKWETGVCAPDIGYCRALCGLYGITPAALLSERPAPPPALPKAAAPAAAAAHAAACAGKAAVRAAKRPLRAGALALAIALALVTTLLFFVLGTRAEPGGIGAGIVMETPGGETERPGGTDEEPGEDGNTPGGADEKPGEDGNAPGGADEPDEPGEGTGGAEPAPDGKPQTYHTLTVYSDVAAFPAEQTVWKDELIPEGRQIAYGPEAQAADDVLLLPEAMDGYLVTGYTYMDGAPATLPLQMTDDVTLQMQTEPRWLDWAEEQTYSAQEAERIFSAELDAAYTFLEGYIRFYEEFCALHARYPQMPRSELFLYLNDPSREPVFPSTVRAEADGVPLTLPMGHIPGGANFPYLSVREALPEKAERFEAFCAEAILQPTLQLAYALTQESVPLEAAVSALKNFGAFVSVGNEAVTKTYRAFVAGHAGTAEYDFPAFTDFAFV